MDLIKNVEELRTALQNLLDINSYGKWRASAYITISTHSPGEVNIYYSGQVNLGSVQNILLFCRLEDFEQIMQDVRLGNITLPDNMGE